MEDMMEELQLSDTLQRYFSDLFRCCDEEKTGQASLSKTIELIKSGNVPDEVLTQISDQCWHPSAAALSKKQFFSALKLVAAHQAQLSLRCNLLHVDLELPLPHFIWGQLKVEHLRVLRSTLSDTPEGSTDSEVDSDTLSVVRNGSTVSSAASDSPTPTNSVQDRNWTVAGAWNLGGVSEEQRQLLEESSDRHSSDEDTEVSSDVFLINEEQRIYYTNQFRALQPDSKALLPGSVARQYFEKSRLPVHELRKIWQLADVTKDGALSLQEFNTAMHLVVLRRNHIELPDLLPICLHPDYEHATEKEPKDLSKEWTKFIDSPTSSVASPGPKPVNFDFQKVTLDKDSKILHPVALRLTPECTNLPVNEDEPDTHSPKKLIETNVIQRPQAKKINTPGPGAIPPPPSQQNSVEEAGPMSLPAFPPPKKEKPPPPPPRPFKSHGRSSSLDLNRLRSGPPTIPPRVSPNIQSKRAALPSQKSDCGGEFAPFDANFEKYENFDEGIFPGDLYEAERKKMFAKLTDGTRRHGAFEVYRKPRGESPSEEDKVKWEQFQKLQEENTVLLRICQELSQELADIREEKVTLKLKLRFN